MAIQSFPVATPTPVQTNLVQGTPISSLVNAAQGIQALQQTGQLNPLQLERARAETTSAQIKTQQDQRINAENIAKQQFFSNPENFLNEDGKLDLIKINETLPKIAPLTAGDEITKYSTLYKNQADAESAKRNLTKDKRDIIGSTIGALGHAGVQDPRIYKDALGRISEMYPEDKETQKLIKSYQSTLDYAQPGVHIPQTAQGLQRELLTPSQQTEINMPSVMENKLGQPFLVNRATGEINAPKVSSQVSTPTTPGVQNFSEYQNNLTSRVAAGTQIDTRINEAESLMDQFKPGAGSRTYQKLGEKLQALGAPQKLVDQVSGGDLSAVQSFNKFVAQSITSGVGQLADKQTAAMMNNYLENNPDVNTDPRALKRFFDFAHQQNNMAYDEQAFLLNKLKDKTLNPDTHSAEAQQMILDKYVRTKKPEGQMPQQVQPSAMQKSQPTQQKQTPKSHGKIVDEGTYNGRPVYKYEDGFIGYK